MVGSITAELKSQVDALEALSPTIAPLQDEITGLDETITSLNAEIEEMKEENIVKNMKRCINQN